MGSSSLGTAPHSAAPIAFPDGGYLPLRDRHGKVRAWAVVDLADFPRCSELRWGLNSNGYAVRANPRARNAPKIRLHRFVLGLAEGDPREADHIDRDPLNNRRSNLRIATHAQNRQNTKGWDNATSQHRGVSWDRSRGKWLAQARLEMRSVFIGRFAAEEEAADAARAWRAEHMPFAVD